MKKLLAAALALMMVLALGGAALAAGNFTPTTAGTAPVSINGFEKKYTVTGASSDTADTVYPIETLTFSSEADSANPDGGTANLTDVTFAAPTSVQDSTSDDAVSYTLNFKHPSYTLPGLYHFTLTENNGSEDPTQGVTYDTDPIYVSVLVTVGDNNALKVDAIGVTSKSGESTGQNQEPGNLTSETTASKDDVVENALELGKLTVSKKVEGNMGDHEAPFTITVALTSADPVRNEVVITADSKSTTDSATIAATAAGWTSKTVTLTIKDGGSVVFEDLPVGVEYTVTEAAKHGNTSACDPTKTAGDEGYKITYDGNESGEISASAAETTVTNTKEIEIDTGVSLDAAPYVLILLIAMAGAVLMILRRRRDNA